MVLLRSITASLLAATTAYACALDVRQDNIPANFLTIGSDPPADPATLGFQINHLSLNVRNLTASMAYYGSVLGMRHIFTAQLSPTYSVTYMGHAHGGKNGTGYQTGEELLREKNNAQGMLELQYFAASKDEGMTASSVRPNTFSHVGLIVPDMQALQDRCEKLGVKIAKRIGEAGQTSVAVANGWGFGEAAKMSETETDALVMGQELVGFPKLLVIEDPDGNLIEVQQLVPPPGVA